MGHERIRYARQKSALRVRLLAADAHAVSPTEDVAVSSRQNAMLLLTITTTGCHKAEQTAMTQPTRIQIGSVDYAPSDLEDQVPLRGRLVKELPGDDRSDYWIVELDRPVSWLKDQTTRHVLHLVVAARWVGTKIKPGVTLPVGISYIIDESQIADDHLHLPKIEYVAIGMAQVD